MLPVTLTHGNAADPDGLKAALRTMSAFLPPHVGLSATRHGLMAYFRTDKYVGSSLAYYGEFSEGETFLFSQLIREGDVVVEVGANIGALTVPIARMVGPNGGVVVFEPQAAVFHLLNANIALNGLSQVRTQPLCLGATPGVARIPVFDYTQNNNFGAASVSGETGEQVEVKTLDQFNFTRLNFLKIDVEGMEREVLVGGAATIARHRPIMYVENDRADNSKALIGQIFGMGYRCWWHIVPLYNSLNFNNVAENIFEGVGSFNMICLPREMDTPVDLPEITSVDAEMPKTFPA